MDDLVLPSEFDYVDLSNTQFKDTLTYVLNTDKNLFIQGKAGTGKSCIIKIASKLMKNLVVLSTTGITAVELSTATIPAKTIHSFLSVPPSSLFTQEDLFNIGSKNSALLNSAEVILIDEVSMMSNVLFDFMCEKIRRHRRDHQIPRLILFGDVMQLPPVIDNRNPLVNAYFHEKYDDKVMFFNSDWFKDLKFKTLFLRKSYRQENQEFANALMEIGYRDHTQETLDYFNQRVMALPEYEKTHKNYIYMSPTNRIVDSINNKYMSTLKGPLHTYEAKMSKNFPADKKPNSDNVDIREGAQVMCLVNNYQDGYMNGTIGEVIDLQDDHLTIETAAGRKKVQRSRNDLFEMEVDKNSNIRRKQIGWYQQIDCKVCRAITVFKAQGKTLDSGFISLQNWTPPGIVYVALSRMKTLDGIGLNRPLTDKDILVHDEAFDFLVG